jgi:hypothetical protein
MGDWDWSYITPTIIIVVCILTILCIGLVETEDRFTNNKRDE